MRNEDKLWFLLERRRDESKTIETGPYTFRQLQERYTLEEIGGNTLCFSKKHLYYDGCWQPLLKHFACFSREVECEKESTIPPSVPLSHDSELLRTSKISQPFAHPMTIVATLIGCAVVFAFFMGFRSPGPPDSVIIQRVYGEVGNPRETHPVVTSIVRGKQLVSGGLQGPKGTEVYPVRVEYHWRSRYSSEPVQSRKEFKFFLNEFDEWKTTY